MPTNGQAPRLLVITADGECFEEIASSVEPHGMRCTPASNCREARESLSRQRFDVILTDVSLPDGNWCDMLEYGIKHDVSGSIVVLTRGASPTLRAEIASRGAIWLNVERFDPAAARDAILAGLQQHEDQGGARAAASA